MKVGLFSNGMFVPLFESDDIEMISAFLESNRSKYAPDSLYVHFPEDDENDEMVAAFQPKAA